MNTKNRIFFTVLVLFLMISLFLTACNLPEPKPTQDISAIYTEVAATMIAGVQPSATVDEQPTLAPIATTAAACTDSINMTAWKRNNQPYDAKAVKAPLAPKSSFTLSWTFQNTGTCTLDDTYRMVYESGTEMTQAQGYPIVSSGTKVAPGELVTVNLEMTAPEKFGEYHAIWRLQNKASSALGTFDIGLTVGNVSAKVPARPENLTYTFECTVGGVSITLSWRDAANNEDGYRVYRDGNQVKELGGGATSYTDGAPRIAGYYTYTIMAFNTAGESLAATMAAKNVQDVCTP